MDSKSKKQVQDIKENVGLILDCYPDLAELEYKQWRELLLKYFWPLVKDD